MVIIMAEARFASDRAVMGGAVAAAADTDADADATFPIKRIAYRNRNPGTGIIQRGDGSSGGGGGASPNVAAAAGDSGGRTDDGVSAAPVDVADDGLVSEEVMREAREAGLRASELAFRGIIPGVIRDDGETASVIVPVGFFGDDLRGNGARKRKRNRRRGSAAGSESSKIPEQNDSDYNWGSTTFWGEDKGEEDDDDEKHGVQSTAYTSPTEIVDAAATSSVLSGASRSSKSSFAARFLISPVTKRTKAHEKQIKRKSPLSADEALAEANELIASGAWMCGVCGTPFDSAGSANSHERACLVEWLKHDKIVREAWREDGTTARRNRDGSRVPIMFLQSKEPLDYPEYVPPRTGGEVPISSPTVKKYLFMTDEALVNVSRRLRHVMHDVVDRDLCALSLKKQKWSLREEDDASLPPSPDEVYTEEDERNHADLFVWEREYDALHELELSSRDMHYYSDLERRAMERRFGKRADLTHGNYYNHRLNRVRATGSERFDIDASPALEEGKSEDGGRKFSILRYARGRFSHAYKLIKVGPASRVGGLDGKSKAQTDDGDGGSGQREMKHDANTLYVNVVVKNSVQMVNNEINRIAESWWQGKRGDDAKAGDNEGAMDFQFEWVRAHTQKRIIQLAGIALASDFTPRKVAVSLSKDLYRLMAPQLKPRGVTVHTGIEYREGPYFVLAVDVVSIDWILLLKWVADQQKLNRNTSFGKSRSKTSVDNMGKKKRGDFAKDLLTAIRRQFPSGNEVVAYLLFFVYRRVYAFLAVPLLQVCYYLFMKYSVNKFILNAVTDDIFRYVEKKGMEMVMVIKRNNNQASFMLGALREIRSGDKNGLSDGEEADEDARPIIGPLMGPAIKDDNGDAQVPQDFHPPDVLEFIALESDLPVGYLRLRWALLHKSSVFVKDAFFKDVMKYERVEIGEWSSNENDIGLPKPPDGTDESVFLNSTLEYSYLMPKSAFVKANMCYATMEIVHYDKHCLCYKVKTLSPEVPYGNSFISWTLYSIVNCGKNKCRLVCSVEPEFPNGRPMVARQIESGMRAGCAEMFVALSDTICRYADQFP